MEIVLVAREDKQREALGVFGAAALHTAAHQHRDAPLDAGTGKLIADETEKWAKVIRGANIKPE
jgi:hypothetical protein